LPTRPCLQTSEENFGFTEALMLGVPEQESSAWQSKKQSTFKHLRVQKMFNCQMLICILDYQDLGFNDGLILVTDGCVVHCTVMPNLNARY